MYALEKLLQFAVIFFAISAMYLLNCAKNAQANPSRAPLSRSDTSFRGRLGVKLADVAFTTKWGRILFALAMVLVVVNLTLSYLTTLHHH